MLLLRILILLVKYSKNILIQSSFLLVTFFCIIAVPHTSGVRKYVIWCLICGGTSLLLGLLFLAVYFLIRSYTSTVSYFETVPSFVPATLVSSIHEKNIHLYYYAKLMCLWYFMSSSSFIIILIVVLVCMFSCK